MRLRFLFLILTFSVLPLCAEKNPSWPIPLDEAKPGLRWWWLGNAFSEKDFQWNIQQYEQAGIGALEITPLYGIQGNEKDELSYLSPEWMKALRFIEDEGAKRHIQIDMNCGTGWPFGGPQVALNEAAAKVVWVDTVVAGVEARKLDLSPSPQELPYAELSRVMAYSLPGKGKKRQVLNLTKYVQDHVLYAEKSPLKADLKYRIIALYCSRTRQLVKRAAPGGEGYVVDHFDRQAVAHYLARFDKAFQESGVPFPNTLFNDSYEVYGADWTPSLLEEFRKRRGYPLEEHLPELFGLEEDIDNQVLSDYRETIADLLYENFTLQWVEWAHGHGAKVRNQAHGSPANLLDLYSAVDIPEIEGFGLSEFGIKGLRTDSGFTRKNVSDVSMLKYASSAAHVSGKPFTSSETFTWLTEHFRTSLSQCKPDLDLMFTCGVNRLFIHGACYSPQDAPWPGWRFYASIDMSPTNTIWHDAPFMMQYIERCQSFLQMGEPDNDFLLYLPVRDMWKKRHGKSLAMLFEIGAMGKYAPEFIHDVLQIDSLGYDCDYISDRYLLQTSFSKGEIRTEAGTTYKAIVIPNNCQLPKKLQKHLDRLKRQGATIIYGTQADSLQHVTKEEELKTLCGLRYIRRKNASGYHYFVANLTPHDVCREVNLSVPFLSATLFDPLTGKISPARVKEGKLYLSLRSGESVIIQTSDESSTSLPEEFAFEEVTPSNTSPWTLSFVESAPRVERTFEMDVPHTWETLDDDSVHITMGTGAYFTMLTLSEKDVQCDGWRLELGDVRESARVYVNDQFVGCAWAVPFTLDFGPLFHAGKNDLRIEVTNLPANRIADMDRRGIVWRRSRDINVVDIHYRPTTYSHWAPMKSGLTICPKLYKKKILFTQPL